MPLSSCETAGSIVTGAPAERLGAEAFAEAFTTHSRALWCIAAGVLGHRDAVEDVLQEGARIALEKLDQFEPDTSFVAWMGRIVHFVALNHGRKIQRTQRVTAPDALDAVAARPASDPENRSADSRGHLRADQRSFDDEVVRALRELEETPRACVLLRTLLDLPYRDIALMLDIPEGTAMSHVHRARRALRDRLAHRAPLSGRNVAST